MFEDNLALLKSYEYWLNKIDDLIVKQITIVKTIYKKLFQDSLASEIWAEIDNAIATVNLSKTANAVRESTNFNRN